MKIIRPYAQLMEHNIKSPHYNDFPALNKIEWCGRISHRSEDAQTTDSWKRFVGTVVLGHGDWSIVEHVSVTVDAVVDRGITHEWVRHRLFSYTQESTRFVNYEKKMPPSFIYPKVGIECKRCLDGDEVIEFGNSGTFFHEAPTPGNKDAMVSCAYEEAWLLSIQRAEGAYIKLLQEGWRPQEARSVFPNALASRIITTGNLRNWRHFFIMRTCAEAHPQMRQVTIPLLTQFQQNFPILFDDVIPNEKQSSAMKKMR